MEKENKPNHLAYIRKSSSAKKRKLVQKEIEEELVTEKKQPIMYSIEEASSEVLGKRKRKTERQLSIL